MSDTIVSSAGGATERGARYGKQLVCVASGHVGATFVWSRLIKDELTERSNCARNSSH
jgi:hypothetical protein